jgi:lysophospholipase L1-like esterase
VRYGGAETSAVVRRCAVLLAVVIAAAAGVLSFRPGAPARAPAAVRASSVVLRVPSPGNSCEQEVARARRPRLVIVGASFTAGVGSGPQRSWAVLLARHLGWDAVVYGDPGAGYVRAGGGRRGFRGPVAAELGRVDLRGLKPSLVIVQAGHDDIGMPPGLEQQRVDQAVALIRARAPRARIALLTVFAGRSHRTATYRTDREIVRAARAADPAVIIIDPLTWTFPRVHDGLHPTAAGSAQIAGRVAAILGEHGVRPAPARSGGLICDLTPPPPSPR